MGHGHSKKRFEVEKIIKEVKDIQSYVRKNCEEFDDRCRENLHTRLIEYSQSLQDIFESVNKKNSKECRDATKLIANVIDELYQQNHLDTAAVETNSFIHVPGKDATSWGPNPSASKEKRQTRLKSDVPPQNKYSLPSLDDIKNKTASLKRNIDSYIKNEEINQLVVEQKIVQILATDLEMLSYEEHTPLQETKKQLEKDLSLLYRKIERAKRRHHDATQSRQREMRESVSKLLQISARLDQIISRVKSGGFSELTGVRPEVTNIQQKVDAVISKNEEVVRMKSEIMEKISTIRSHLDAEPNDTTSRSNKGGQQEQLGDGSEQLTMISRISSDLDQCMNQARAFSKENSSENLLKLKDKVLKCKSMLREYKNCDKSVMTEVEEKVKNALTYLETCIERTCDDKKSIITRENLEKASGLLDDCRNDILKFDENTSTSDYDTYSKHLTGLENFLNKIVMSDIDITKRKQECMKHLQDCRDILRSKLEKHLRKDRGTKGEADLENRDNVKSPKESGKEDTAHCDTNVGGDEAIVLRKPHKILKCEEIRTVDGFYVYWKELQSNLPSYNCTLSELKQIALLLKDIEDQIRQKRIHIENFLCAKQQMIYFDTTDNHDRTENKTEHTFEGTTGVVKTNAKIYKLSDTKQLINEDDDEIIQSVDEIKENSKKIFKENPERVFLPSDSSASDSIKSVSPDKVDESQHKSIENITKETKSIAKTASGFKKPLPIEHIEHISQIQNIACSVEYLKEKALRFVGSKQSPQYADIKSKLDSYRRTLNILTSYQNENITLSCNRVITNIDEVIEILNNNSEKLTFKFPQTTNIKRGTIENLFKEIIEMKTRLDDIEKTIESFEETEENEIYQSICDELLHNRRILNEMQINPSYEVILNSKLEVLKQIDVDLYNLDIKLQENKRKQRQEILKNTTGDARKVVNEVQKMKDKVERFSGTYKNVLYKEIEKGFADCLKNAEIFSNDKRLIENLKKDVKICLKILEQKAIKEYSDSSQAHESRSKFEFRDESKGIVNDFPEDIAIQLSEIRQHYKEIQEQLHAPEALTTEENRKLSQTIDSDVAKLDFIDLRPPEPFYLDRENLKQDFLKLSTILKERINSLECHRTPADGESVSQNSTLNTSKSDTENAMISIEENLECIKPKIEDFANEKASADFFNLDESLTRLSMNIDKIPVTKGTDLHKKKTGILKNIYACCETLESQAQSYEILQNVDKKINEVKYRLENFHELSDGDYGALYRELTDLEVTLRELTISGRMAEKMLNCQMNIRQCLDTIEGKCGNQDARDSDSDGTSV